MVFYDNLENEKEQSELKSQREKIKDTLAKTLELQGFSASEVKEVINIVDVAEDEIQKIKDSLIGTNLNENIDMEDPMRPVNEGMKKMRAIELKMAEDIKLKVAEIKQRH